MCGVVVLAIAALGHCQAHTKWCAFARSPMLWCEECCRSQFRRCYARGPRGCGLKAFFLFCFQMVRGSYAARLMCLTGGILAIAVMGCCQADSMAMPLKTRRQARVTSCVL